MKSYTLFFGDTQCVSAMLCNKSLVSSHIMLIYNNLCDVALLKIKFVKLYIGVKLCGLFYFIFNGKKIWILELKAGLGAIRYLPPPLFLKHGQTFCKNQENWLFKTFTGDKIWFDKGVSGKLI